MTDWQWKNCVKKRDDYVCRRCGFNKNLHVHHILPKEKYPYEQDYPPNGVTLCGNCHSLLKDKEEQTDLRGFLPDDPEIDNQLKYLNENASLVSKSQRILLAGKKSERINKLAKDKFQQANDLSDQGEYKKALVLYDDTIRLKSDFVEAYYHRGKAKYELKRYKAAIYDYDKALSLKPDYVNAYFNRGLAKYALRQYQTVITDYNMVLQFTPDNVSAYFNRGLAKYKLRQRDAAIVDFDEAICLNRDFVKAYYYRGLARYEQELYDVAIVNFDEAIRLNSDFTEAYHYRGLAKCKQELYDAAIADFDKVIRLDSDFAKDAFHEKLAIYDMIVGLNPNDALSYYYRGQTKAELGQHKAARTDYDTAVRLRPRICYDVLLREIFGHHYNKMNGLASELTNS